VAADQWETFVDYATRTISSEIESEKQLICFAETTSLRADVKARVFDSKGHFLFACLISVF
jgi:hypothetical protein